MADFYEPTLLFRQNAIKRFSPNLSPISSVESLMSTMKTDSVECSASTINSFRAKNSSRSSWLLNFNNPKDTEILNKSCSLDQTNIRSNYWKIPDDNMNLTSMCISKEVLTPSNNPLLAIASGNIENNLFIYELNTRSNHLIHHSTISLSNIHNMKWINRKSCDKNHIITGNNKGYAHLVSIPKIIYSEDSCSSSSISSSSSSSDDDLYSAEICKRFNHRKYIKDKKSISINTPISKLDVFNNHLEMISIYNDYLFHWDVKNSESQQRPTPLSITTIHGIKNFDLLDYNNTTLSICGKFGVSLFDIRLAKFNIPMALSTTSNFRQLSANVVKWNPSNDNILAAGHGDGVVRLWDIRKQDYFATLTGNHSSITTPQSRVTSIEWSQGDLITGGHDGNILYWDLTSDIDDISNAGHLNCGLREGLSSVQFNNETNNLEIDVNQRQCGTVLPASNTNIVSMCSVAVNNGPTEDEEVKILSIDGSSFLGVHSRVKEAIELDFSCDKQYYTEDDLNKLLKDVSLVEMSNLDSSIESLVEFENEKPLVISRRPTITTAAATTEATTTAAATTAAATTAATATASTITTAAATTAAATTAAATTAAATTTATTTTATTTTTAATAATITTPAATAATTTTSAEAAAANDLMSNNITEYNTSNSFEANSSSALFLSTTMATPRFNHDSIEIISLDDFDFTLNNNNTSQSDVSTNGLPQDSPMNESMDSLSTMATIIDENNFLLDMGKIINNEQIL
ncbi:DSE1 [Candida oxycetoniae]|uniref:DSE1 n=1 Tax=Candida oxycetoniae TaxID=497107 RepID=A0AAI9WY65_9ASCO|nr:DSE1 [Candida oxycetoniae]KAI3404516.2 DSE1 [Candida oxycetoniae]